MLLLKIKTKSHPFLMEEIAKMVKDLETENNRVAAKDPGTITSLAVVKDFLKNNLSIWACQTTKKYLFGEEARELINLIV